MLSSRGNPNGVAHRGMGVDRGVVLGVAPGEEIRLRVVGLITPLNAFTGLMLGYEKSCKHTS